jgi:hypothetical protein
MRNYILVFFVLFYSSSFSQENKNRDSISAVSIKLFNTDYKDFEIVKKMLYALTKGDILVIFDLKKEKIVKIENDVFAIAKNKRQEVVYVNANNELVNTKTGIKEKLTISLKPYRLLFDHKNNAIFITDNGLIYKNQRYNPTSIKYNYRYYKSKSLEDKTKVFQNPDLLYLDNQNRLWLTYDKGEFGGDILFFDLEDKIFYEDGYLEVDVTNNDRKSKEKYFNDLKNKFPDKIKIVENDTLYKFPYQLPIFNPIRGIAEKDNKIFISQSLIHFFVNSNFSVIEKKSKEGFYKNYRITKDLLEFHPHFEEFSVVREFLGPIQYNPFNNAIYYYTDKGFFKIIEMENSYNKEFVFKPWISWSATNRNNVGADINITKFEFIGENKIFFLTTNNGIGYFDGNTVTYYK